MAINGIIYSAVKLLGGLLLVVGYNRGANNPKWSRIALFIAGVLVFISGILTVMILVYSPTLNPRVLYLARHFSTVTGSICLGILFTLFLSGELSFRKLRKK